MKRRNFLIGSAGLGIASQVQIEARASENASMARHDSAPQVQGEPARIQEDILVGRNQRRSTVLARNGICATSHPLAVQAGIDVLKSGGNAVDAAIAMNAVLGVVEPMSCGPGGDLFAIVWIEKEKKLYGLNASGRSPYAWTREEAKKRGYEDVLPEYGPHTWNIPGCVSGWGALQKRLGKLPFKDLLKYAAQYAYEGFGVTEIIAEFWSSGAKRLREYENAAKTLLPNDEPPKFGQVFRNPDQGRFLEILMNEGADAYYQGEIAERIVKYSQERGGVFSMRDFQDHEATWVEPVSTNYRGYDLWEIPPNGQGIAALQMANMLETFDIGSFKPNSAEHLHLLIEAKKLAFEDRSEYYADMDMADVPLDRLISKEYGKERAKLIDPKKASQSVKPGELDGSQDTVYLCAADGEGNMVSFIQSVFHGWGSHEMPTGLGFCLQNRGRSFKLDPQHRNTLEPHKRPFHTIIPAFLTQEGKPVCAFGVMGGDFQPQGHVQVLLNMIDFGFSMQQAGEQPRVEHNGSSSPFGPKSTGGGTVNVEAGITPETIDRLREMGHEIDKIGTGRYGGYQAIWRHDDPLLYLAGSEPRNDGCAMGY